MNFWLLLIVLIVFLIVVPTVWSVKKKFKQFNQFLLLVPINAILVILQIKHWFVIRNHISWDDFVLGYITDGLLKKNLIIFIPIFLSTRFISSRFIFRNLAKNNQSSARIISRNPQQFGESELISFIEKIQDRDFPKASISKSSISGDYVIVRDLKGVVLSQIKIAEID